jgi:hypothetical protein
MKIYITHDDNKIDGFDTYSVNEIEKMSTIFYKNQLSEIYAPTILNYIDYDKTTHILLELLSFTKRGGNLLVGGIDSSILCSVHLRDNVTIPIECLNSLLFCRTPKIKSLSSLKSVKNVFLNNTRIEDICVDENECRFTIKVTKI